MTETLAGELGRSPTPAELAARADATVEQILNGHAVRSCSLDRMIDR
jgi:hypothetical protein